MREFKVGDEVQANKDTWGFLAGLVGQIRGHSPYTGNLLVCFPELNEGEEMDRGAYGRNVWPMEPSELVLLSPVEENE